MTQENSLPIEAKWIEVDLDALENNYREIRQKLAPEVKLLGVVKADAYGHGAVEVSRKLAALGVDMLGVTTPEEGRALREGQVSVPILVFGAFLPEEAAYYARYDLTATVACREAVDWLKQAAEEYDCLIKVHLKVETGMGRFGLWPQEVVAVAREVSATPGLYLEGVYSHLATAMWQDKSYSRKQFRIFTKTCAELEETGCKGLIKHIANSAAVLELPEMHLDMVRVGTLLYGQAPAPRMEKLINLKDSWSLKAKVIYIKNLPAGHTAGYGRVFKAKKPTTLAILPVGFVDGIQMEPVFKPASLLDLLKGMAKLLLRYLGYQKIGAPIRFPQGIGRIVGKVGMQLIMVDISEVEGVAVGTIARIPARRTAVNPCIPKVFFEKGQMKDKTDRRKMGV